MGVQVERAEARLLDHCSSMGRWLDEDSERTSAPRRLRDTLDVSTIAMLRRGLAPHPAVARGGLRSFS
jgi:hypothetical protein